MNLKIVAIVVVAFALRLIGVAFGWPGQVHPDEALYMPTALRMLADRSLLPGDLFHNSHFLTYIDMVVAAAVIGWWRLTGMAYDAATINSMVWLNTNSFVVAGRLVSVVCGTLTVLAVFRLGRMLWNDRVAAVAALLLAVSPLHVRDSHFGVNDALMTMLLVIGAIAVARLIEDGPGRWSLIAGGMAGLAAGAKYNGGILIVAVLLGHFVQLRRRAAARRVGVVLGWSSAAVGAAGLAFVLSNVAVVLDPATVVRGFLRQVGLVSTLWPGQESGPKVLQDFHYLVQALGVTAVLLAAVGFCLIRSEKAWVVLTAPLAYLLVMSASRLNFARFMLPVLPFACLAAGVAVTRIADRISATWPRVRASSWAMSLLMAVVLVPPAVDAVRLDWLLSQGDTRLELSQWLKDHGKPGMTLLADDSTLVGLNPHSLPAGITTVGLSRERVWRATIAELERANPDLIVFSSFSVLPTTTIVEQAKKRWPLVLVVSPFKDGRERTRLDDVYAPWNDLWSWRKPGPYLWVFQRHAIPGLR